MKNGLQGADSFFNVFLNPAHYKTANKKSHGIFPWLFLLYPESWEVPPAHGSYDSIKRAPSGRRYQPATTRITLNNSSL